MKAKSPPAIQLRSLAVKPVGLDVPMQRLKTVGGLGPIISVITRTAEGTPIAGAHIKTTNIRGLAVPLQRQNSEKMKKGFAAAIQMVFVVNAKLQSDAEDPCHG